VAQFSATKGPSLLEPRSYSTAPIGTSFVLAGFGGSKGGILFDPALDVDPLEADLHSDFDRLSVTWQLVRF
jgi:hypothetical protein